MILVDEKSSKGKTIKSARSEQVPLRISKAAKLKLQKVYVVNRFRCKVYSVCCCNMSR